MTYIQPNQRKSILNILFVGLVVVLLVNIFWLVTLYNNVVNLNHEVASVKAELDGVGAKNAALNDTIIGTLHNLQSSGFAAKAGLVPANHPQYFSLNQKPEWPIASQR